MSEKQAKENGISIMPMKFYVDGEEYSSSEGKITITGLCEKMGIAHCFVVDSLTYLARGGRISQKSAFIGNLINIKPVMHLNDEGKIVLIQKVLGRNRSLKNVVTRFRENYNGKFDTVFITHADCLKDAEFVAAEIKKINPALKVIVNELGNVITCHSGPGTMAVYFTTDSRKEV